MATCLAFLLKASGKDLPNAIEAATDFYVPLLHEKKKTLPTDIIPKEIFERKRP